MASPNAAADPGDAAQAAFDRKLSHYRQEISDLRNQGFHYRPLVWTPDGRPDMLARERAAYQRCFPAQLPLHDRQRFDRQKSAHLLQDLSAAAPLPPHSAHFLPQLLDLAHTLSERQDNDILALAATDNIFIKTDPGRARVPRYTRPLAVLLAAIARLLARRQPCTVATHCVDNSANCECGVPRPSPQLPPTPAARSSNGAFLFGKDGKDNHSSSRITSTLSLRHPLCSMTVRISLQWPSLHCEVQRQSSRSLRLVHLRVLLSMSGTDWSSLGVSQERIAPSLFVRHSTFFLSFVHVFPARSGSVPDTFSLLECSNSSARLRSFPEHISFRIFFFLQKRLSFWPLFVPLVFTFCVCLLCFRFVLAFCVCFSCLLSAFALLRSPLCCLCCLFVFPFCLAIFARVCVALLLCVCVCF